MPDHLTPAAEALLADILAVHRIVGRLNDAAKDMWREKVAYAQSEARATAPLLAERDALRAALEDIADRYVSDNNIRPAGFAKWAGERALAALTPQAPAASVPMGCWQHDWCGLPYGHDGPCNADPAPAASGERCGHVCTDSRANHDLGRTDHWWQDVNPFQPAEPEGGAA